MEREIPAKWRRNAAAHTRRGAHESSHAARELRVAERSPERHTEGVNIAAGSAQLEAIAKLAGGVAHDFNNALTAILAVTEARLAHLDAGDPLRRDLEQIEAAAGRAGVLTMQLLAFARTQIIQPQPLDLTAFISELETSLLRLVPANIQWTCASCSKLGAAELDPRLVEQLLRQLIINACEAMPDGGELVVETANIDLTTESARPDNEPNAREYVMLAVRDTGCGMDAGTRAIVFDPFFTTKGEPHRGLGLSAVYGMVKQMSGQITVHSEPGQGSRFELFFPRVPVPALPAPRPSLRHARGGAETILLVEDDDLVRAAACAVLRHAGYRVIEARSAEVALELWEVHAHAVELIISDVVMPSMNGRELVARLKLSRPDVPVLYMSGYTRDAIVRSGVLEAEVQFLQKPFSRSSLGAKVREVLSTASARSDVEP
jgi:two-component system cell cycle sensor histidine kinase/response regulator CckA